MTQYCSTLEADSDWEATHENLIKETQISAPVKSPPAITSKKTNATPKDTKSSDAKDICAPLDDPVAEKLRQKKLIEQKEAELFGDLLDGCDLTETAIQAQQAQKKAARAQNRAATSVDDPNSLNNLGLKNLSDCQKFVDALAPKILESPAKSVAWLTFMTALLPLVVPKMDDKDLKTLQSKLCDMSEQQVVDKRLNLTKKKVENVKTNQIVNSKAEYDMFYGEGDKYDYDEDDYEDEDAYEDDDDYEDDDFDEKAVADKAVDDKAVDNKAVDEKAVDDKAVDEKANFDNEVDFM